MTIDEMKQRKAELRYTNRQLSALSGVPEGTVNKILSGATRSPGYTALLALEKVLAPDENALLHEEQPLYQADTAADIAHKKPGEFTLEDYLIISEDRKCELIDGVIYDMASPSIIHQRIISKLIYYFETFIEANHGRCKVMPSMDTQLDRDNKTVVEPDLLVYCGDEEFGPRIVGAPDLAVEVVSKSSKSRDMSLKVYKYMHAGVREYWIIDPFLERVLVYQNDEEMSLSFYTFEDRIPVGIYDGRMEVDLAAMSAALGLHPQDRS